MNYSSGIDYLQSQMNEEHERERRQLEKHDRSIRELHPKIEREEILFYHRRDSDTKSMALQRAIEAIEKYQEMRTRK